MYLANTLYVKFRPLLQYKSIFENTKGAIKKLTIQRNGNIYRYTRKKITTQYVLDTTMQTNTNNVNKT